jgi:hypothetical protein
MGRLQKLKILNISGNFFAELPEAFKIAGKNRIEP